MIGGLAIVEDAHHHTARLDAVPADCMERRDEENLALAKSWMPKLPCDLDVLIVDEMGKNISGTGMDAKVVNRGPSGEYNPWPGLPSIRRLFVRELDPETYGNALGIGMADVTTDRLVRQIDWEPTRVNALSSGTPSRIRVPAHFATDRECLEWIGPTAGRLDPAQMTFGWIGTRSSSIAWRSARTCARKSTGTRRSRSKKSSRRPGTNAEISSARLDDGVVKPYRAGCDFAGASEGSHDGVASSNGLSVRHRDVRAVGTHHANLAIGLRIHGMQRHLVLESRLPAGERDPLSIRRPRGVRVVGRDPS